ncbi:hypothetical protein [Mucilaginibacter arboris]|uniref:DUF5640 domain-containing protein n=1 Tax=Mucilaginibacter arboris TaxID=2682090 RepID=A0A7K1T123_9SPHI|nr:hypothetical protein [Mucilaginibacter arboris]MVN23266.1 hypothetical protein [Mucilaginibacter arboris]
MMKNYLQYIVISFFVIVFTSCKNPAEKNKIMGNWRSEDKKTGLKITAKEFTLDEGEDPIAESYFVKGDTIFTSYEGAQPYTKFAVKDLTDKSMTLVYPDSTTVTFVR